MNRFLVWLKIAMLRSLIITLVTRIFNTFMNRFSVPLKMALCCEIIVTLVTRRLYTFVDCFLMLLKIVLFCRLISAVFTGITNTFMLTAGVIFQTSLTFITCLTFLILVQLLARPLFTITRDIKAYNFINIIKDTFSSICIINLFFIVMYTFFFLYHHFYQLIYKDSPF